MTIPSHTIRPANEKDFPSLKAIYDQSKLDELRYEKRRFSLLPLEKDKKRLSQLMESQIFVYGNVEVLGYGAIFESEIRALFISPPFRKKGIGKTLLEHLLGQSSGETSLYVAKSNQPAKALYQKYGFVTVDEFETTYNGVEVFANKMVRA